MAQYYNPEFDRMLQGNAVETDEAEILSAVRKVMIDEKVEHPEVAREIAETPTPVGHAAAQTMNRVAGAKRKIGGYRPRWSHNLAILMLAAFVYSTLGTAMAVALVLAVALILYWSFGPDRFTAGLAAMYRGYHRISPVGAAALQDWGNRCSARAQRLADRLPERYTQGLYLPTFGDEDEADLDAVEPFDRLVQQRRSGQAGQEA